MSMPRRRVDVLGGLARLVLGRPVRALALTACLVLAAAVAGAGVAGELRHGGTVPAGAESTRADELLTKEFHGGAPTVTLVVGVSAGGSVDDAQVAAAGRQLTRRAARMPKVVAVGSYWPARTASLRGRDGRTALIHLRIDTTEADAHRDVQPLLDRLTGRQGPLEVRATGPTAVRLAVEQQSRTDLFRTELLEAPLVACVLVAVFGGVVAAGLALLVGLSAMVAATAIVRALCEVTEVSVFALNLVTALGFALAVDFSLFVLARYREERATADTPYDALVTTVRTTGRTVVCSALTVIGSLAALVLFPVEMLRSIAYGGIAVVATSAALAVTALPAALLLLGPKVDALALPRRRQRKPNTPVEQGSWYRLAHRVMRRPLLVLVLLGTVLTALVLPFTHARFGALDDRSLPPSSPTRQATETLRRDFDYDGLHPVTVVLPGLNAHTGQGTTALDTYAREVSALPHVRRVETATGSYTSGHRDKSGRPDGSYASKAGVWLAALTDVSPETPQSVATARAVRAVPAPVPALVGGTGAWLADLQDAIRDHLAPALALIAAVTLLLLGWCTRSVVLPLKALALNALSLTATFGILVFVFQQGHLDGLLGFTATGVTDTLTPVLVLCVAFGLSMDYEVLLLSRAVEEHAAGAPTREAVARAVQHTAGLFTASAAVVIVVMSALATSGLVLLKVVGLGLALAVLIDATAIRLLVAPALMALMGEGNWWLPGRRRRKPKTPAPVQVPVPAMRADRRTDQSTHSAQSAKSAKSAQSAKDRAAR